VNESPTSLPDGWYGAAVVNVTTSNGKVAVIAHLFFGNDIVQTYNAFPQESTGNEWVVPLFTSRLTNGLSTPVAVQNLNGVDIPANKLELSCKKDPASGGSDFTKLYSTAIPNNKAMHNLSGTKPLLLVSTCSVKTSRSSRLWSSDSCTVSGQ
jgi:hypothetical protein